MQRKQYRHTATTGSAVKQRYGSNSCQEHHVPPPVDIYETRMDWILLADLPGSRRKTSRFTSTTRR